VGVRGGGGLDIGNLGGGSSSSLDTRAPPRGGPRHGGRTRTGGTQHAGQACCSGWTDSLIVRLIIDNGDGHNNHFASCGWH
jgi:hypothetical protein